MATMTTMTQTEFNSRKANAIANELVRKELNLSEFQVLNNETISIDGKSIHLNPHAFAKLLSRLRIPKAFANRFMDQFGSNGLSQLVEMMKTAKASKNDQTITLLVNPKTREIIDVLPQGYAAISNESFVNFAERYIDNYNLDVTSFGSNGNGGVSINCVSPNSIFKIPGLETEVFNSGVTFTNSPTRGLEVSPFLSRLICSNGMTSTAFSENFGLHTFSEKNIKEFNDHMVQMASNGFQPIGLREQITKATNTQASLAELQRAASIIMNTNNNIDFDYIQRYTPINRAMAAYQNVGSHPHEFTTKQLQNATAGISVYDMVNGITNFASNDTKYGLDDHARTNVMIAAGNLMMKKQYDTEGILNVNPFANSNLLTASEAAFVRGDK